MSFRSVCPTCGMVSIFQDHHLSQPHTCIRCGEFRYLTPGPSSRTLSPTAPASTTSIPTPFPRGAAWLLAALVGFASFIVCPMLVLIILGPQSSLAVHWLVARWYLLIPFLILTAAPIVLAVAGLGSVRGWLLGAIGALLIAPVPLLILLIIWITGLGLTSSDQAYQLGDRLGSLQLGLGALLIPLGLGCLLAMAIAGTRPTKYSTLVPGGPALRSR